MSVTAANTQRSLRRALRENTMRMMAADVKEPPDLKTDEFPYPTWTRARTLKNGKKLPQAIAHRGYKAKFPENTMASMKGAVEVGTHALETDIHLTKDDVVVLSHDQDLKRCFGRPERIIDCEWEYISSLRTHSEHPEPMPRLIDLLQYLSQPGLESIWLLLDIKLDNDPNNVMRLIADAIESVPPAKSRPWNNRIVLGIWASKYLPLCASYLPGFPISYIGFSTAYARQFFAVPNVSFNMLQAALMGPVGSAFIRKAQALHRPVFAWTVNEEKKMRWGIRKRLDGIVTDDPRKFLEVCDDVEENGADAAAEAFSLREWWQIIKIQLLVMFFGVIFRWKFKVGWGIDQRFVRRGASQPAIE